MMKKYLPLLPHKSLLGLVTVMCLLLAQEAQGGKIGGVESIYLTETHIPIPVDVTGTIKDSNGEPLIGVNVLVKGTGAGTSTDIDGGFSLNGVAEDAILVISYIGFQSQEVPLDGRSFIEIVLEPNTQLLDEVVVVGYGTQKKVNLTGAVGTAGSDVFENRAITSLGQGLLGVVPGLNINYNSGNPNESADFNIRGFESISGGEPLILVDGIPMNVERINPNDIESVSVLKDASSAAIYGARAAFGVILVTTKKGQQGKLNVNFSTQTTMQKIIFPGYEPVTDGGLSREIMNQARQVTFGRTLYPDYVVEAAKRYQEISNPTVEDAWYRADDLIYFLGTNLPKNLAIRDYSPQQNYNFNISGAGERTTYYVSLGATDKKGFFKYNSEEYNRYNALFKLDFNVTDWLTLEGKMMFTAIKNDNPHEYSAGSHYNSIGTQWFSIASEFPDLEYYLVPGDRSEFEPYIGMLSRNNPAAYLKSGGRDVSRENEILFSQAVKISPFNGFIINGDFSYRNYWSNLKRVHSEIDLSNTNERGYSLTGPLVTKDITGSDWIDFTSRLNSYIVTNIYAEYTVENLGYHQLKGLVGINQEYEKYEDVFTRSTELITPSIPSLSATTGITTNSEGGGEFILRGLFYRLNYSYKDKYLFEANGRYDGTSKFPKNNRFGFFPSFAGAWRITEESFMDVTKNWLDGLKLRASYGILGNQNVGSFYPYISVMGASTSDLLLNNSGDFIQTISPGNLVSRSLTWETVTNKNLGIDISAFSNRLNVSFDYFIRDTKDMLMNKSYPGILGTSAPKENAADLRNVGWELSVGWIHYTDNDWSYRLNVSLSDYETTITKYENLTGAINDYYVGKKIGEIWGYQTVGLFQTKEDLENAADQSRVGSNWRLGDIRYADLDGDGIITTGNNTLDNTGDRIRIGNTTPRYSFGVNPQIKNKSFTLDIFLQGVLKRDWMPTNANSRRFFPFKYVAMEQWWIDDSWSPENPDAYFPGIQFAYSDGKNVVPQTRWLQNAAYLRVKSVTLSYNVPLRHFQNLQVYVNGENLLELHSMYKTLNPVYTADLQPRYFFHRSFTVGLNASF